MRTKPLRNKKNGGLEVELIDVSPDDLAQCDRLIERFLAATPHGNESAGELVQKDVQKGYLSAESLERLSVWCHTNQAPSSVNKAAEELTRFILGLVPPRLRDAEQKRVHNYETLVTELAESLDRTSKE